MPETFGQRLRALRVERGLQQGDLAGPGVSVSYISMLENDNREPTARVLDHLAEVLSVDVPTLTGPVPADELTVGDRLALATAEVSLAHGDHADALAAFAALEPRHGLPATWGRARALDALGRLDEAAELMASVAARAGAEGEHLLALRALIKRSRCLQEAGEPVAALDCSLAAVATVDAHGLAGTDEHAQAVAGLMGCYYEVGDIANAERIARDLLAVVDAGGSWSARGSAYWNAAGVAEAAGDMDTAVAYAGRAVALFSEGDDERASARCAIAYAWFWMRHPAARDHLDDVDRALASAEAKLATSGTSLDLVYLDTEKARAALLRDHPPDAADLAQRALDRLGADPVPETLDTLLILAEAYLALVDLDEARGLCDRLEMTLLALPATRASAQTWRGLADAWKRLGEPDAAYRALERALDVQTITASPTAQSSDTRARSL